MKRKDATKQRAVKDAKRAARTIIGEPSRGRKRGPHKVKRRDKWNEEE